MSAKFAAAAFLWFALMSMLLADATMEAVQRTLKEQGFYYGEANGEKNAETTAAIRRYQIRNGLQITGELNDETTKALGIREDTGSQSIAKATPTPPSAPMERRDATTPEQPVQREFAAPPQNPAHPAPEEIYDPAPVAPGTPSLRPVDPFIETPYEMAPPDLQNQIVLNAQARLARQGYYQNAIDGIFGPGTEVSIRAYQTETGLEVTGRLDMDTLASLRLLPNERGPGVYPGPRFGPRAPRRPIVRGEWIPE